MPLFCLNQLPNLAPSFFYTFHAPDSRGQIGAEEATLCRLGCQAANRPKPEVDCTWGETTGLEMHAGRGRQHDGDQFMPAHEASRSYS
jgi:hypothetical protein